MRLTQIILCLRLLLTAGFSQAPMLTINVWQPDNQNAAPAYLNGYRRPVSGQTISYHSSHPDAEVALLCRVRRDANAISWETDTLPDPPADGFYHLIWLAGIERIGWGNATHPHIFHMSVNGERRFTFTNRKDSTAGRWTITGKDAASLSFESRLIDRYGDLFGTMTLDLPAKNFRPGSPIVIAVDGEDAGSPEWYMTFQYRFNFVPRVRVEPALVRDHGEVRSLLRLSLDNLQEHRTIDAASGGSAVVHDSLHVGGNIFFLPVEPVEADRVMPVQFRVNGRLIDTTSVTVKPVRKREIYLLSHTHNDIGYTDLQPNVEKKQWQNLDQALSLIQKTKDYPPASRYKWNLEILWPFESYMRNAPAEKRTEVLDAIRSGSLGLNALLVNPLTGLANATEMSHFTDYARQFTKEYSIPITTAAVSDVPGFTWGIVPALAQSGVKYFASAPNSGDRIGYVIDSLGDKPFWWTSQSGKEKVLFWLAGSSYASFHEGMLSHLGPEKVMKILRRLEEAGYPYDLYYLPYTLGDNGGPDSNLSDFVRDWNEKYVSPKLVISTHRQMFEEFERRYGPTLPTRTGDFTPYWEDGAASTAYETGLNRRVAGRLMQGEALWSILQPEAYPENLYDAAWRNVVLWDEHTWGADKSVSDPDDPGAVGQWRIKRQYVLDSDSLSGILLNRALPSPKKPAGAFDVYNTSGWRRSDVVYLSPDQSRAGDLVVGEGGSLLASQRLTSGELAVFLNNVPPMSARRIFVRKGKAHGTGRVSMTENTIRNEDIVVTLNHRDGSIASLILAGREYVDTGRGLNQYLYVRGTDPDSAVQLSNIRIRAGESGSLISSLLVTGDAPGCRSYSSEIRVISGVQRVDITNTLDKNPVREKEAVHFAFPFGIPTGRIRYDVAGGIVEPEQDQLAGSCKNFFSVQRWMDVSGDHIGITLVTPDAPLAEIGSITAESPWLKSIRPSPVIYSYVMNNYWHTNYKADQEGVVQFRYSLYPHRAFHSAEIARVSRERCQPFIVAAASTNKNPEESLCSAAPNNVVVESVKPIDHGRAWLLYLYNPTTAMQHVKIRWSKKWRVAMSESSAFGERGRDATDGFALEPWGTRYLRVSLASAGGIHK